MTTDESILPADRAVQLPTVSAQRRRDQGDGGAGRRRCCAASASRCRSCRSRRAARATRSSTRSKRAGRRRRCCSTTTTTCSRRSRWSCGRRRRSSRRCGTASCTAAASPTTRGTSPRGWPRCAPGARCAASCPARVKFCIEGDEEIGSPQMEEFVERAQRAAGRGRLHLGGRRRDLGGRAAGHAGREGAALRASWSASTISGDAHSSYGTVLPNAAWRLAWALASIKGPDERVLIEGFYDDVRPPTPEERAAVEAMPHEEAETLKTYGIQEALAGVRGLEYRLRHLFEPTATIDGLSSGYEGEGPKTVLPARAMAKMDFRLVPTRTRTTSCASCGRTWTSTASATSTIINLGGEHPARTPVTDPLVRGDARRRCARPTAQEPLIVPTMAGTGPLYPFVTTLGLPTADCGIGYPDARDPRPGREHPDGGLPRGDEGDRGAAGAVRGGVGAGGRPEGSPLHRRQAQGCSPTLDRAAGENGRWPHPRFLRRLRGWCPLGVRRRSVTRAGVGRRRRQLKAASDAAQGDQRAASARGPQAARWRRLGGRGS